MGTARVQLSGLCPHNVPREEWLLLKPIHKGDPVSGFLRLRLVRYTRTAPLADQGSFASPLFAAVCRGDLLLLVTSLKQRCDPNCQDAHGNTPLHHAAMYSENEHVLLSLLRLSPTPLQLGTNNVDGNTPLQCVCLQSRRWHHAHRRAAVVYARVRDCLWRGVSKRSLHVRARLPEGKKQISAVFSDGICRARQPGTHTQR